MWSFGSRNISSFDSSAEYEDIKSLAYFIIDISLYLYMYILNSAVHNTSTI